jgi:hypothetical protein
VDLVYGPVDLFYRIFFRKIILKISINPRPLYFLHKGPWFNFIYVLVPKILQNTPDFF